MYNMIIKPFGNRQPIKWLTVKNINRWQIYYPFPPPPPDPPPLPLPASPPLC
jgi:hypothetical protein